MNIQPFDMPTDPDIVKLRNHQQFLETALFTAMEQLAGEYNVSYVVESLTNANPLIEYKKLNEWYISKQNLTAKQRLKQQALAKLTDEEKQALGL